MTVAARLSQPVEQPIVVRLQQGIALYRQGDYRAAEEMYTGILLDDPGEPHALHLLGLIAEKRGDLAMAESLLGRANQIEPHSRVAHNLGVVLAQQGRLDAAIATYRQALALEPDYLEAATNLLFALDLHPHVGPEQLLAERLAFASGLCDPLTALSPPHENDRDPGRRLRVGYVSPDFRHHSAAASFGPPILGHDPEAVEVYLYSTAERHDEATAPFRDRADVWCEVGHLADPELAQVIRGDRIDVLVDLAGYSQGGRPLLFALKPAPIQVTGWGYGTGTGLAAMDYLVADDVAAPPESERFYREKILRLPCLLAYAPGKAVPELNPTPPQKRNGYRTYGYLGRAQKVNAETLALWARVLRADPSARLLLKHGQWEARALRDMAAQTLWALGVSPDRVEVRGQTSRLEHLAAYNLIDVALDTFPQSGGITTLDALLMGVPTVTLLGETIPSRTGASILTTIGYRGLVAPTPHDYVGAALRGTPRGGRRAIRAALMDSILVKPREYAAAVEAQYRAIWRRWCTGRGGVSLDVAALDVLPNSRSLLREGVSSA